MIQSPAGYQGDVRIKRYLDFYQAGYGVAMLSSGVAFSPLSLFANGEQGGWYDPSDLTTLYQDAAGTTPVTAVEQPVGLVLDKSRGLVLGSESVTTLPQGAINLAAFTGNAQSAAVTVGKTYKFVLTVTNFSSGQLILGTGSMATSSNIAITASANGTYTAHFVATDTSIAYRGQAAGFNGTISLSVRELPGSHLSQSTAAARPVLSARVNLLERTEQFDNAYWAKTNVTASGTSLLETAVSGFHFVQRNSITVSANTSYVLQAVVKPNGRDVVEVFFFDGATTRSSIFSLTGAGSVASNNGSATGTISANADGSYTCRVTATLTSTSVNVGVTMYINTTTNSYLGDITKGVFVQSIDLRPANAGVGLPAYQRVGAATSGSSTAAGNADYDTTGFPLFLRFDGTDDFLQSSTITPGSVDKAQVFAGVRKLSDATQLIAETSADSFSNNGTIGVYNFTDKKIYVSSRGTTYAETSTAALTAPITRVLTLQGDISAPSLKINDNAVAGTTVSTSQGTGNYASNALYIGRRNGATIPANMQLYSLIFRFSATNLDAATITATETWVNQRTKAF